MTLSVHAPSAREALAEAYLRGLSGVEREIYTASEHALAWLEEHTRSGDNDAGSEDVWIGAFERALTRLLVEQSEALTTEIDRVLRNMMFVFTRPAPDCFHVAHRLGAHVVFERHQDAAQSWTYRRTTRTGHEIERGAITSLTDIYLVLDH